MFLQWIASRRLLTLDDDALVLSTFPEDVRLQVIQPVATFIDEGTGSGHQPSSPASAGPTGDRNGASRPSVSVSTAQRLPGVPDVKWVMQCIGAGLELGAPHEPILNRCISIYSKWLLGDPATPQPILDSPDDFFPVMIKNLSLAFKPMDHATRPDATSRHVAACRRILNVLNSITITTTMSRTVDVLLRVLIGVADYLICREQDDCALADALCDDLLSTLLETWLKASFLGMVSDAHWAALRSHYRRWRHRPKAASWWSVIVRMLTHRLATIMVTGEPSPCQLESIKGAKDAVKCMTHQQIILTWHRVLPLIGHPNGDTIERRASVGSDFSASSRRSSSFAAPSRPSIDTGARQFSLGTRIHEHLDVSDIRTSSNAGSTRASMESIFRPPQEESYGPLEPDALLEAMQGLADVVNILLNVPATAKRPSGAALLALFGEWLFSVSLRETTSEPRRRPSARSLDGESQVEAESQAIAIGTLCRIFCQCDAVDSIPEDHVWQLWAVLVKRLAGDHTASVQILINSETILVRNLPGSLTIIEPLMCAIERCIARDNDNARLRQSCFKHLHHILSLPNELPDMTLRTAPSQEELTMASLKQRMFDLCVQVIRDETNPDVTKLALSSISMFLLDHVAQRQDLQQPTAASALLLRRQQTGSPLHNHPPANLSLDLHDVAEEGSPGQTNQLPREDSNQNRDTTYVSKALDVILRRLEALDWALEETLSAFDALRVCLQLLPVLQSEVTGLATHVIRSLCRYIEAQISQPPPRHKRDLHTMIVAAYHTLLGWVLSSPGELQNLDTFEHLLQVILIGLFGTTSKSCRAGSSSHMLAKGGPRFTQTGPLAGRRGTSSPSFRVEDAALLVFRRLQLMGSCARSLDAADEEEMRLLRYLLSVQQIPAEHGMSYYAFDGNCMFCLIPPTLRQHPDVAHDQPDNLSELKSTAKIIVRDELGTWVWEVEPLFQSKPGFTQPSNAHLSKSKPKLRPSSRDPSNTSPRATRDPSVDDDPQPAGISPDEFKELLASALRGTPAEDMAARSGLATSALTLLQRLGEQQLQQESARVPPPKLQKQEEPGPKPSSISMARRFFSQLGFLHHTNLGRSSKSATRQPLEFEEVVPDAYLADRLQELDRLPRKETVLVRLFSVGPDGSTVSLDTLEQDPDHSLWAFYHDLRTSPAVGFQSVPSSYFSERLKPYPPVEMTDTTELCVVLGRRATTTVDFTSIDEMTRSETADTTEILDPDSSRDTTSTFSTQSMIGTRSEYWRDGSEPGRSDGPTSGTSIVILWGTSVEVCGKATDHFPGHLVFFVCPLPSGLFYVKTKAASKHQPVCGPLGEGTIASERVMASLIRSSITNTVCNSQFVDDKYQFPHVTRRRELKNLVSAYAREQDTATALLALFPTVFAGYKSKLDAQSAAGSSDDSANDQPSDPSPQPQSQLLHDAGHTLTSSSDA